jgi:sec-independent protein translocase protein TatA
MHASVLLFLGGGLGGWEIALLIFVVLLLFGAKRIPELARGLGRGIREFKDATNDIRSEIDEGVNSDPKKKSEKSAEN